jgi:hypothetical protein
MGPKLDTTQLVATIEQLPDPNNKKQIISGSWASEVEQRNISLAYAVNSGCQIGMVVDADEIYEPSNLQGMIALVRARPEVDVWHMCWYTYWKSPQYRIDPIEPYHPPVFVRIGNVGFTEARNLYGGIHELIPPEVGMCHHMSYARSDELVKRKIGAFTHANQILDDWFDKVWKRWDEDPELTDLHPVIPAQYKRAVVQPADKLPSVLRNL